MRLRKPSSVEQLLTEEHKTRILQAIQVAEQQTSGEIRVHIEPRSQGGPSLDRAADVFYELGMDATKQRNGILVYVALDDRQFAIIGDQGIHAKVGDNFWQAEKDAMASFFANGDIIGGIIYFIEKAGEKLKEFFPYQADDVNELSDDISTGA